MGNKNSKSKTKIIITSATLAVLSVSLLLSVYIYLQSKNKSNQITQSDQRQNSDKKLPDSTPIYDKSDKNLPDSSRVIENKNTNNNVSMVVDITGITQDSSNLYISTIISGATEGSCLLKASKVNQPTIQVSENITIVTNYYSCGNLKIARSQFGQPGEWQYVLAVRAGSKTIDKGGSFNVK